MTTQAALDLIFRRAVTQSSATPVDIGVKAGRIAAVAPHLDGEGEQIDLGCRASSIPISISTRRVCSTGAGTPTAASATPSAPSRR
jgi:hypothetical protein